MPNFTNFFPNFSLSGEYEIEENVVRIKDLDADCKNQACSSPIDFFPKWSTENGELVLRLKPRWIDLEKDAEELTVKLPGE